MARCLSNPAAAWDASTRDCELRLLGNCRQDSPGRASALRHQLQGM